MYDKTSFAESASRLIINSFCSVKSYVLKINNNFTIIFSRHAIVPSQDGLKKQKGKSPRGGPHPTPRHRNTE